MRMALALLPKLAAQLVELERVLSHLASGRELHRLRSRRRTARTCT